MQIDIDLPQIAVIGNQSAGKSSLIEAISGITLPRQSGTCTRYVSIACVSAVVFTQIYCTRRCPTECRLMRSSGQWQCTVSLRLTVDANGLPLGQARTEKFGDVIFDKAQVEERIRRAQRAILNQGTPARVFLTMLEPEKEITDGFSANCITLHISGPDVADLSFCDLPGMLPLFSISCFLLNCAFLGLIASVGQGGNDRTISIVENLVTSYIKKPSCIILLTVACESEQSRTLHIVLLGLIFISIADFENQGAHRLAKVHDPQGIRTIGMLSINLICNALIPWVAGVLTKPDRIPPGDEPSWIPYIRNEKEALENNWFSVKQPSTQDLQQKITWAQARQKETDFFASTAPWSDIGDGYHKYLGTSNLVRRLTDVLSELIATRCVPLLSD